MICRPTASLGQSLIAALPCSSVPDSCPSAPGSIPRLSSRAWQRPPDSFQSHSCNISQLPAKAPGSIPWLSSRAWQRPPDSFQSHSCNISQLPAKAPGSILWLSSRAARAGILCGCPSVPVRAGAPAHLCLRCHPLVKRIRMLRVKRLIRPHHGHEVFRFRQVRDAVGVPGQHLHSAHLFPGHLKPDDGVFLPGRRILPDPALPDQPVSGDHDKDFPLAVVPVLPAYISRPCRRILFLTVP